MAFGRRILKDSNTIPDIPHQIRMGKDGEEEFWENNDEQDQEVVALCQCFEETKKQLRSYKNHREDLQEGCFGGGDEGGCHDQKQSHSNSAIGKESFP